MLFYTGKELVGLFVPPQDWLYLTDSTCVTSKAPPCR